MIKVQHKHGHRQGLMGTWWEPQRRLRGYQWKITRLIPQGRKQELSHSGLQLTGKLLWLHFTTSHPLHLIPIEVFWGLEYSIDEPSFLAYDRLTETSATRRLASAVFFCV